MKSLLAFFGALSLFRLFRNRSRPVAGVFAGETWSVRVVRVIDGDTLWVSAEDGEMRIRLAHIDAPEVGQPWADEAASWLAQVVPANTVVILKPIENDRFGRVVADLYTRNWRGAPKAWVNYWLARNGLAWAMPAVKRLEVAEAQLAAQKARLGVWTERYPTPPWEFRANPLQPGTN